MRKFTESVSGYITKDDIKDYTLPISDLGVKIAVVINSDKILIRGLYTGDIDFFQLIEEVSIVNKRMELIGFKLNEEAHKSSFRYECNSDHQRSTSFCFTYMRTNGTLTVCEK
jgi:hypothetical protein